jgi:ABC-type amino acid transport substrate-binding protein
VGGLLLKQNAFLRAALDTAIKALIDDGTIRSIITEYAFPAQAKS